MKDININWVGPLSLDEAYKLRGESDRGLYQYYGDHLVYGHNVLLYLGRATDQSLGKRLEQNNWQVWSASPIQIYVGRLCGDGTISAAEAKEQIKLAEAILLFSHGPAFNTANLNSIKHKGEDVRVMNWGKRKSLLPEVSISRWESGAPAGHVIRSWMQEVTYGNGE